MSKFLRPFRFAIFALLVVGPLGLLGCGGGGSSDKLVPVSGKVMSDADPLTTGTVTFYPDESKGNKTKLTPSGMIDKTGNYKLSTSDGTGAPLGWYKVAVSPMGMGGMQAAPSGGATTDPNASLAPSGGAVNKKYLVPESSGLRVEVVASPAAGAYDLKVTK